ncbi:MAG TPA: transglutaminase domain-containing protein [Longimicrobiaceae bacterium]|nr:transglutaminase domain-containing protein [Longimicrobiaceae bacterium]
MLGAAFAAVIGVYFAGSPVAVEDPRPVFAAKVVAKRALAEAIVAAYALRRDGVPMPTPDAPVPPLPLSELAPVPALGGFLASAPRGDLARARVLADWLARSASFGPPRADYLHRPTAEVLQAALDGEPFLCDDLARLYARLAPRVGLDVRLVYLWAASEANHVVAEVYSRELGRWVMVDVLENLVLLGPGGTPLSALEAHLLVVGGQASAVSVASNAGGADPARRFELAAYLRKYESVAYFLRSDLKRLHALPRHHPANLLSQNMALYRGSRGWLPRLYYRQRIGAEQLAAPPRRPRSPAAGPRS